MATDVDGVYARWGTPEQERLSQVTPEDLAGYQFPAGSMGRRSRPRPVLPRKPAGGPRSARWKTSPGSRRERRHDVASRGSPGPGPGPEER